MIIDDISLFGSGLLVSQPMYLISAVRRNALLACRISALISSNFSVSIVLVRMPCTMTLYV